MRGISEFIAVRKRYKNLSGHFWSIREIYITAGAKDAEIGFIFSFAFPLDEKQGKIFLSALFARGEIIMAPAFSCLSIFGTPPIRPAAN